MGAGAHRRAGALQRARLRLLRESGLKMVFSGAESGSDEALERMGKGGRLTASMTLAFFAHEPAALTALAGRLTRVPVVVSVLGGEFVALPEIGYGGLATPFGRGLVRLGLCGPRRVAVMGARSAARLRELGWARVAPDVLPLGVDLGRFHPDPSPQDPRLEGEPPLLAAASLVPVKDHERLLQAFARVLERHPRAVLHLAGDGRLRRALERRGEELGVAPRLRLWGSVEHDAMPGWYRSAELLLVSSRHERLPTAALEALACGTLVVGTAVGILPELPGCATVPADDAGALAAAASGLLDEPARRRELSARGRAAVNERYSLDRWARRMLELWGSP